MTYAKKGGYWTIINHKGEAQTVYCSEEEIGSKAEECVERQINTEIDQNIPISYPNNVNTFALVYGNQLYMENSVTEISFAKRDSEIFTQYLLQTLGIPEKNIHHRTNATQSQIKSDVSWMSKIASAYGPETSIIIYYAGHGIPDPKSGKRYILPSDGDPKNVETLVNLDDIYSALGTKNISGCYVFLDACFTGRSRSGESILQDRGITLKNIGLDYPKLFVLSATNDIEAAYNYGTKGHGMYTFQLLSILNSSNGKATIQQIVDFVKEQTLKNSLLINNVSQTPTVYIGSDINMNKSLR